MIFTPKDLSTDYTWNGLVEHSIAALFHQHAGLCAIDFSTDARGQYDWRWEPTATVELKTTLSENLRVEMSKDECGTIPSGLGGSTADIVVVLMRGRNNLPNSQYYAVGKLRVFDRRKLVALAKRAGNPYHYNNGKLSEHEYGYELSGNQLINKANELWAGDVEIVTRADGSEGYDLAQFSLGYIQLAAEWVNLQQAGEL